MRCLPQNYLEALEELVVIERVRILREQQKKEAEEITEEEAWINVRKSLNSSHTKKIFKTDFAKPIEKTKKKVIVTLYDSVSMAKRHHKKHYQVMRSIESLDKYIRNSCLIGDDDYDYDYDLTKTTYKTIRGRTYNKYHMSKRFAEMMKMKLANNMIYKSIIINHINKVQSIKFMKSEKKGFNVNIF